MLRSIVIALISTIAFPALAESAVSTSTMETTAVKKFPVSIEPSVSFGWAHQNDSKNLVEMGPWLDLAYPLDRGFKIGLGAGVTFGEEPSRGFDVGGGPFISFSHSVGSRYQLGLRESLSAGFTESTSYDEESERDVRTKDNYLSASTSPFVGMGLPGGVWIYGSYRYGYSLKHMHSNWASASSLVSLCYAFE